MTSSAPAALIFVVRRNESPGGPAVGTTYPVRAGVLGRGATAAVSIEDATISREHARLEPTEDGGLLVENLSESSVMFAQGRRLAVGERTKLAGPGGSLQVGAIVLALAADESTVPFQQRIDVTLSPSGAIAPRRETKAAIPASMPVAAAEPPLLTLIVDGDCCTVRCREHHLDVSQNAARALLAMCRSPGRVVHEWDLQSAVGERINVPQLMSAIRRALKTLLDRNLLDEDTLRELVARADSKDASELTGASLLRRFVVARRGHGYAIFAPPEAIRIEEEG